MIVAGRLMQQLSLRFRACASILLGCWALAVWGAGPVAASGGRVWLDPATLELAPGDVGTLDIRVENVTRLAGAEVHLTFDAALLEVVDADPSTEGTQITHGEFLSPDFVVRNEADPSHGTVDYAIACMDLDRAASGGGVLAHITFRALAEGESRVTISGALLADAQGRPIAVETDSSVVAAKRSGPSIEVRVLIGLVAAAVAAGSLTLIWNAVRER